MNTNEDNNMEEGVPVASDTSGDPTAPIAVDASNQRRRRLVTLGMILLAVVVAIGVVVRVSVGGGSSEGKPVNTSKNKLAVDSENADTSIARDNSSTVASSMLYLESPESAPFASKIPLVSTDALKGYEGDEALLAQDILEMGKSLVNRVIEEGTMYFYDVDDWFSNGTDWIGDDDWFSNGTDWIDDDWFPNGTDWIDDDDWLPNATGGIGDEDPGITTASRSGAGDTTASEHETNSQRAKEGDVIKSDGVHVFAAFGSKVLVWEAATGNIVTEIVVESSPDNVFDQSITSLILEQGRLAVITTDYGGMFYGINDEGDTTGTSSSVLTTDSTTIRLYDVSAIDAVSLVGTRSVNGYFQAAHSTGSFVSVVTVAYVTQNFYGGAFESISRWNSAFDDMTDEEYIEAATKIAEDTLLPEYVSRVLEEIKVDDKLPELVRFSLWQTGVPDNGQRVDDFNQQSLALVTSFNLDASSPEIPVSTSGSFMPCSGLFVYSSETHLLLAGQGYDFDPTSVEHSEKTYLLSFTLDGVSATPTALGNLPGYLVNSFSLDFVSPYIRVATTLTSWAEEATSTETWTGAASTTNELFILEVPTSGNGEPAMMIQKGSLVLGKAGEVFASVRYFGDFAYAVTFLNIDPFYVLDLSDPTTPKMTGELEITGFSSYLHPMNTNNTLLVTMGMEATEEGEIEGMHVTVFDATDASKPKTAARYVIKQGSDGWLSSSALFDHKAFRYVKLGEDSGRLIIPVTNETMDALSSGYKVFSVSSTEVAPLFDVVHSETTFDENAWMDFEYDDSCVNCQGFMAERSLVFDDLLTTMAYNSAIGTNLTTGDRIWDMNLTQGMNCCPMFW